MTVKNAGDFFSCVSAGYGELFPSSLKEVTLTVTVTLTAANKSTSQYTLPIILASDQIANLSRDHHITVGKRPISFCGNKDKQRLKFWCVDKTPSSSESLPAELLNGIQCLVFNGTQIDFLYSPTQGIYSEKVFKDQFSKAYENRRYIGMSWFPKLKSSQSPHHEDLPLRIDMNGIGVEITTSSENSGIQGQDTANLGKDIASLIKNNWVIFSDGAWRFPESSKQNTSKLALGRTLSSCIWFAVMYDTNNADKGPSFFSDPLPSVEKYIPPRRIDLHPFELKAEFKKEGLYYTISALNSLAVALNSGDHVILTGPPGSGKTELATQLPQKLNQPYLLCTASPDWTTNELIGRYMPTTRHVDKAVLRFEPGFLIQAISDGKWLIIDELNRADIDSCMGPLFSVLSGHEVILPYKTSERYPDELMDDDSEVVDKGETEPERRVGICLAKDFDKLKEALQKDVFWYKVSEDFRILCTMNDSDAGMLNQLSYALQRRFSVIRVEAPEAERVRKFILAKCEKVFTRYQSAARYFPGCINNEREPDQAKNCLQNKKSYLSVVTDYLIMLFADKNVKDLMQLRVVGFGQVADIITTVIEGLSCPPGYTLPTPASPNAEAIRKFKEDIDAKVEGLILTLLANGVVMKVLPQLPAFICNRDKEEIREAFLPALKCIAEVFVNRDYYALGAKSNAKSKIIEIKPTVPKQNLLDDYLEKELKLLFRNQHVEWQLYWRYAKLVAKASCNDENRDQYIGEAKKLAAILGLPEEVNGVFPAINNKGRRRATNGRQQKKRIVAATTPRHEDIGSGPEN